LQVQLIVGLYRNEAYRRSLHSFSDRICISEVVFVTLAEGLGISWRYLSHIMTERKQQRGRVRRGNGGLSADTRKDKIGEASNRFNQDGKCVAVLTAMPAVTAEKTRTRVACVLDWAKAMGYREYVENVARAWPHGVFAECYSESQTSFGASVAGSPCSMRELRLHSTPAAQAPCSGPTPQQRAREGGARCDRSEIKSSSELEQIAKLPNHLVQGETWVAPAEPMKEGKEHHVPIPPEAFALIAGRKGKLLPGHESQMLDLLTSRF
jgi:hypothetical protein